MRLAYISASKINEFIATALAEDIGQGDHSTLGAISEGTQATARLLVKDDGIIAGLEFADSGTILFDGEDTTHRNAGDRRVGFVFQHYALFRHMTVAQNIAFGLTVRPRRERPSKRINTINACPGP